MVFPWAPKLPPDVTAFTVFSAHAQAPAEVEPTGELEPKPQGMQAGPW
jgi:hypothetical protein